MALSRNISSTLDDTMSPAITEITPLSDEDCFYLVDRFKSEFDYPLHRHEEIELNFVENCEGARRIVGDSVEILGKYDLVMVGTGLEHVWEQYKCRSPRIREITIQFSPKVFGDTFLAKNQLKSMSGLFDRAKSGVAFSLATVVKMYKLFDEITQAQPDFYRVLKLMEILYLLSKEEDYQLLSSTSFANTVATAESRRIHKVEEYIKEHYRRDVRLEDLAVLVCMTPSAFSRFFKLRTGRTVSDYIIDVRLGHAARLLAGSMSSVLEICFECGFNNVSNFNRIFKRKKGCSPSAFREYYRKNKIVI